MTDTSTHNKGRCKAHDRIKQQISDRVKHGNWLLTIITHLWYHYTCDIVTHLWHQYIITHLWHYTCDIVTHLRHQYIITYLWYPAFVDVIYRSNSSAVLIGVVHVSPIATTLTRITGQHRLHDRMAQDKFYYEFYVSIRHVSLIGALVMSTDMLRNLTNCHLLLLLLYYYY